MSDTVTAPGQLRAFVERIERIEAERAKSRPFYSEGSVCRAQGVIVSPRWQPGPMSARRLRESVPIADAALWLDIVGRLCRVGGADEYFAEERKGFTLACRLTGLSWNEIQKAILDVRVIGADEAARHWFLSMRPADARIVGSVYSAYSPTHPSVVKVGFSRTPAKRMVSLSRQHGVEIRLGVCLDGTMLHEWAIHQILRKQVAPEWYRASDIPSWLMPLELREAA